MDQFIKIIWKTNAFYYIRKAGKTRAWDQVNNAQSEDQQALLACSPKLDYDLPKTSQQSCQILKLVLWVSLRIRIIMWIFVSSLKFCVSFCDPLVRWMIFTVQLNWPLRMNFHALFTGKPDWPDHNRVQNDKIRTIKIYVFSYWE